VRHKNIVEVLDFGDDRGRLFMVMEHLDGESLGAFLKREAPLSPSRILPLLEPVIAALTATHAGASCTAT
jgi:serine/threonine protein kinase